MSACFYFFFLSSILYVVVKQTPMPVFRTTYLLQTSTLEHLGGFTSSFAKFSVPNFGEAKHLLVKFFKRECSYFNFFNFYLRMYFARYVQC